MAAQIESDNLTRQYVVGQLRGLALNRVSLSVEAGTMVAVLGRTAWRAASLDPIRALRHDETPPRRGADPAWPGGTGVRRPAASGRRSHGDGGRGGGGPAAGGGRPDDGQGQSMRVVIAEDSALLREGLASLISEFGGQVVARVADGPSLVAAVVEHRPDVSVVDVRMPPNQRDEGLRAAIEARRRVPGSPVLVLSQYVERQYATELLADRAGGVGYLLKDRVADVREFMDALRRVMRGGTALDPEVVAQLMVPRGADARLASLTPREREVLAAMAEGRTNLGIASLLGISEGAAEKHISNIFAKLELPDSENDHRRVLAVLAYLGS
jgi:DNA-binding NarL/FixJ family response regulator